MNSTSRPKRPRWLRFSLRTFLLLLTALCIWMGIVGAKAVRQRRAIEAISAAGGTVYFDYEQLGPDDQVFFVLKPNAGLPGPKWLRRIIGNEFFRSAIAVSLTSRQDVNRELFEKCLNGFPDLEFLRIENASLTDDILSQIAGFQNLRYLGIDGCIVNANDLQRLQPLTSLKLISSFRAPANRRIIEKLDVKTDIIMTDVPLFDVAEFLSNSYQLSIQFDPLLDRRRMNSTPVTELMKSVELRTALNSILTKHELAFDIRDNSIVITTAKAAEDGWAGRNTLRSMFPKATIETDW